MRSRLYAPTKENEVVKQQKRLEFFKESKLDPTKSKYGLFSYAGSLSISKSGFEEIRVPRREADGSVRTAPRNFSVSPSKKGKGTDSYFSPPIIGSVGEPYRDPLKSFQAEHESNKQIKSVHESAFKAAGPSKSISSIPYMLQGAPNKSIRKDPEGGVYFGPRNFYTSPTRKGNPSTTPNTSIGKFPEFIEDPYDRKNEARKAEIKKNSVSIHERAFRSMSKGGGTFADPKNTFGREGIESFRTPSKPRQYKIYQHEKPFLPSSRTNRDKECSVFAKFPEFMPCPEPKPQRKSPDQRVPFKRPPAISSTPTPSVVSMLPNIKAEYSKLIC